MNSISDLNNQKKMYNMAIGIIPKLETQLSEIKESLSVSSDFSGINKITDAVKVLEEAITNLSNTKNSLSMGIKNIEREIQRIRAAQANKQSEYLHKYNK